MRKNYSIQVARRRLFSYCSLLALSILLGGAMGTPLPARAQAKAADTGIKVLVVGDSISAEYGLTRGSGWVALLQTKVAEHASGAAVINASISGDTTAGGRSRLPALLKRHQPTHVVLELGGNDALRGLDLRMTEANLSAMAKASRAAGAQVTVVGMQVPPNYGSSYARDFRQAFVKVAKQHQAALVPFLLKGVADGDDAPQLFQADRIHPNEQAQARMLDNVWPVLLPQLK